MKRILFIAFAICLSLSLCSFAFASAGEGETSVVVPDVNVFNEIIVPETDDDIVSSSTSYFVSPVTAADTTGLKSVLLEFLGDWEPVVVETSYTTTSGNVGIDRQIQPDYPWLCSAVLLVVLMFCLFRLGGSVLCRK